MRDVTGDAMLLLADHLIALLSPWSRTDHIAAIEGISSEHFGGHLVRRSSAPFLLQLTGVASLKYRGHVLVTLIKQVLGGVTCRDSF